MLGAKASGHCGSLRERCCNPALPCEPDAAAQLPVAQFTARMRPMISSWVGLNFQNRNGFVPPYQARQLIEMIVKYQGSAE